MGRSQTTLPMKVRGTFLQVHCSRQARIATYHVYLKEDFGISD